MSRIKWVIGRGGMALPACPRCGVYPLVFNGRDEYRHYLFQCRQCGSVITVKTHPSTLAVRAIDRFRRWG